MCTWLLDSLQLQNMEFFLYQRNQSHYISRSVSNSYGTEYEVLGRLAALKISGLAFWEQFFYVFIGQIFGLLICTFDSDFRKVGQFATLEKYQVLGTIFFFSSATIIFSRFVNL